MDPLTETLCSQPGVVRLVASGWLWFLGLFGAYILGLFLLVRTGLMRKWNLSLMLGFVLMIRTQRGKGTLEKLSKPKRAWNAFGDLGVIVVLLFMALMTLFMVWTLNFIVRNSSQVEPLSASEIFVIPGVNPFIPLWYGLIGLIVTLIVHEGGHGVLARANDLKVKSLGLLYAIVPIGAFVEPDEDELKETTRRKRLRVFAAGPMVNIVVALITLGGFVAMVGAAEPAEGVPVLGVTADGPAHLAGIEPSDIIVGVNDTQVLIWDDFTHALDQFGPGQNVTLHTTRASHDLTLTSRWDTLDETAQRRVLEEEKTAMAYCSALYDTRNGGHCADNLTADAVVGIEGFRGDLVQDRLAHPFTGANILFHISLPIGEVQGQPTLSYQLPAFFDTPWNSDIYWPTATVLFWVFWLNLMVGLFNVLPMLPLDGGHIFRDAVAGLVEKTRPGLMPERRDKIVGRAAAGVSWLIFFVIIAQIIGPRLL